MKVGLIKLLMLASLLILTGCSSLDGTVSDTSGSAIADAQVVAVYDGGSKSTKTDANGQYALSNLGNSGDVTVTVTKEGYESNTKASTLTGSALTLNFILNSDEPETLYGNVSGTIKDVTGTALEGVRVYHGATETSTDDKGHYTLELEVGEKVSITAELENYAQNSRNVAIVEAEAATLDLTLAHIDTTVTFDVLEGANISTKGASVELGASTIVNMDGSVYEGQVTAKVSFNQVTSLAGRNVFPGDYVGIQENGEETNLQSYGFIDVTLEDASANPLRLADAATAKLTYPKDTNIETTPESIPLWYYDVKQGAWIEDGVATYDAATESYSGTVTHFTTWNLDAKFDGAALNGCIEDANGARITDAMLYISMAGNYKTKHNIDADGKFRLINAPSGVNFALRASAGTLSSEELLVTLAAGEDRTLADCLVVDQEAPAEHTIIGRLLTADGTPIANQYINIRSNGLYLGYVRTDAAGNFYNGTFIRPENNTIELSDNLYIDGSYVDYKQSFALNTLSDVTNLGTIEVKTSKIMSCVQRPDGTRDNLSGYVRLDTPYNSVGSWISIDNNGAFSHTLIEDNKAHIFYAFSDDNTLTKSFTVTADKALIDMTSNCIVLDPEMVIDKNVPVSITGTDPSIFISVTYDTYFDEEYIEPYGENVLIEEDPVRAGNFKMTHNGIYNVMQTADSYALFDGTISVTIDGTVYTVTIPSSDETYEAWSGYAIELYQGNIRVIETNKEVWYGECGRGC